MGEVSGGDPAAPVLADEFEYTQVPCEAVSLVDGEILIFDWAEFCEATNSHAAMMREHQLFVLERDTLKWKPVEGLRNKVSGTVQKIK